ncbi:MAG: DUF4159 domain-containing protein [Bacteroidetes bacterium]|nr:DUF4159 domain-containing protein [Bacteroidota bacterium]
MRKLIILALCFVAFQAKAQYSFQIGLLKYNGGGDWYANPTSLPNLVNYCNQELNTNIDPEIATVEVGSPEIFNYPFLHMTGHGNVVFSAQEISNLSTYLMAGGFLHIDDNYGMDQYIRPILNKLIPNTTLVEIPFSHELYHGFFDFKNGLPKIHEHDDKAPKAYGLFYEGRLLLLYTYETDLGDGWEDQNVHKDSQALRQLALQMGANIIKYVFSY